MALKFLYELIDAFLCNKTKSPDKPKEERQQPRIITGDVVFLDIDGVLHPGCSDTLKFMPNLYRVLDLYPDLQVVICSNWRETASFEYLQSLFNVHYRHRLVGVTPTLPAAINESRREAEISQFLSSNKIKSWFIIDDEPKRYGSLNINNNIFATDTLTALDDVTTQQLISWLRGRSPG